MIKFSSDDIFIVTGASSGIGEDVAITLNYLGAKVVAIARNQERLQQMKEKCKYPNNIFLEIKDICENISELSQYVSSLKKKYGKFAGMAYCAGIVQIIPLQMSEYSSSLELFNINYFAPMQMAKGVLDKRNNIGAGTSMVFISSFVQYLKSKGMSDYAASKSALTTAVGVVANEASINKIRVNTISPADISTPMTASVESIRINRKKFYPLGLGKVEDVSSLTAFLLSNKAGWITGQDYIIDGGFYTDA